MWVNEKVNKQILLPNPLITSHKIQNKNVTIAFTTRPTSYYSPLCLLAARSTHTLRYSKPFPHVSPLHLFLTLLLFTYFWKNIPIALYTHCSSFSRSLLIAPLGVVIFDHLTLYKVAFSSLQFITLHFFLPSINIVCSYISYSTIF